MMMLSSYWQEKNNPSFIAGWWQEQKLLQSHATGLGPLTPALFTDLTSQTGSHLSLLTRKKFTQNRLRLCHFPLDRIWITCWGKFRVGQRGNESTAGRCDEAKFQRSQNDASEIRGEIVEIMDSCFSKVTTILESSHFDINKLGMLSHQRCVCARCRRRPWNRPPPLRPPVLRIW